MLYFKIVKDSNSENYHCYKISPSGEIIQREYKHPIRKTDNGKYQYRKDLFFGLIKNDSWSKERSAIDTMQSLKELRDWEITALMFIIATLIFIIFR